jgi:iron complex transport system substrate-binding protein
LLRILSFSRRLRIFFWARQKLPAGIREMEEKGMFRMSWRDNTKRGAGGFPACLCLVFCAIVLVFSPAYSLSASQGPMEIKDFSGKTVSFAKAPERIISTAPGITECLFSLGLGDRIVAVTRNCNYPPEAQSLPRIGDLQLNIEKIIELKPDLIVTDVSLHLEQMKRLEALGFRVFAIDCSTMAKFGESLKLLGKATAREERAHLLVGDMNERAGRITRRLGPSSYSARITVFIEIWDKPLMTAGCGTFFDDLISLAGGMNAFGDTHTSYPRINIESLIERDPGVIILTTSKRDDVMKRSSWKDISAIRSGRVHEINPDIIARPTVRMLEALELMALWLHPEIRSKETDVLATKSPGPLKGKALSRKEDPHDRWR